LYEIPFPIQLIDDK